MTLLYYFIIPNPQSRHDGWFPVVVLELVGPAPDQPGRRVAAPRDASASKQKYVQN